MDLKLLQKSSKILKHGKFFHVLGQAEHNSHNSHNQLEDSEGTTGAFRRLQPKSNQFVPEPNRAELIKMN